jgi:hypothetical protein
MKLPYLFKSALRKRIKKRINDLAGEIASLKITQSDYPYGKYPKEFFHYENLMYMAGIKLKELQSILKTSE